MSLRAWLALLAALALIGCRDAGPEVDSLVPSYVRTAATVPSTTTVTETEASANTPTDDKETVPWGSASISDRKPPAARPVDLTIDRLGINAEVVGMGIDADGRMDVPGNVSHVGWYRFGASPGEDGSAVLAAHVDLAGQGPGIFFHVDALRPDDEVVVGFDDGSERTFVVVSVERIAKSNLDINALFSRQGGSVLHLVTCGGAFDPQIRRYEDNVVVTLTPVQES